MNQPNLSRHVLALAVVALVAACGGGDNSPRTAAQGFSDALASQRAAPSDRLRALAAGSGGGSTAAAATVITNAQLFQGAEVIFPDLFPTSVAPIAINNIPYDGKVFQVRMYSNGNYLGVANDGNVYGLGAYTDGGLANFGAVQSYADLVCSRINCGGTGGGTGPVGPLNGCTEGASVALVTGRTLHAVYISSVLTTPTSTGEFTTDSIVNGAASFENQSTVKVTSTIKGVQEGRPIDVTALSYHQASDFDLTRTVGNEISASAEGIQFTTKVVYAAPASLNNEFSLALGGSMSKTETMTSLTVFPGLPPTPNTSTSTTNYTYETRESVTVPAGTFSTCRYKSTVTGTPGSMTMWVIVGRGISAKSETLNAAGTVEYRSELKSATINGGPI